LPKRRVFRRAVVTTSYTLPVFIDAWVVGTFLIGHRENAGWSKLWHRGHTCTIGSQATRSLYQDTQVAVSAANAASGSGENLNMRKNALKLISVIAVAVVFLVGPQRAAADDDDPPTRVARLSQADGSVSFEPAGTEDWVTAVVNRPLTTGDKLWSDQNSRAELGLGSASIRLGASTGFSFLNLDDRTTQLQLTEGTLRIRVRRLSRDEVFEVDTPNLAFTLLRPGTYRVNVNEAGDTTVVVVREGEGEVTGGGQSFAVHANETGIFSGTDQLNADIEGVGDEDDLERWSSERDRREDHSASRQYVSDEAIGYQDLDEYGGWRNTPNYGTIWFPRTTVVGWAPYRYGHWAFIAPWGYTWVDDEPWGFAPFHYGRWVAVGGAWGWVPCRPGAVGVAYARPVYAPALVAWVGGPHVAIGVAVGGGAAVGWFPLGPREVYVPSYRVSRAYVNNVNVTNTTVNTTVVNNYYNTVVVNKTTVNNVTYVNQRVPGAVTATSTQVMSSSQPVGRNIVRVDERQIGQAQVTARPPAVAPERQAFLGGGRTAQARPPERIVTRAVVARTAPPPPPARIDRQQELIRQNGGQPPAVSQIRRVEPQQQTRVSAPVRMAPPARQVTTPERNAGNRTAPPQNSNRPVQQQGNVQPNNRPANTPANAERPNNAPQPGNAQPNRAPDRPNNAVQPNNAPPANNAQPNRPADRPNNNRNDRPPAARPNDRPNTPPANAPANQPSNAERPNAQPNRPPVNDRSNTPPPNAQPNRPANNERPANERNDRPPAARTAPPPPAQEQQRPAPPPARTQPQEQQRPPQGERPAPPPARTQPQEQQRPPQAERPAPPPARTQPQEQQRPPQAERPAPPPARTQPQEQQRPPQAERPTPPPPRPQPQERPRQEQQRPPQAERQQQPPPRQQQERPKQQEKEKPKDKDKPPKG
jgi:hypothetical protein